MNMRPKNFLLQHDSFAHPKLRGFLTDRFCHKRVRLSELKQIMLQNRIIRPPKWIRHWPALRGSRLRFFESARQGAAVMFGKRVGKRDAESSALHYY